MPASQPAARSSRRRSRIAGFTAAIILVVAAGVTVIALANRGSDATPGASAATSAEGVAATWVDRQVSHNAIVACDRVMCGALRKRGFPGGQLEVIEKSSLYPVHAQVVIETPVVRGLFGSSLATNVAPESLVTFGSGRRQIAVRIIAPVGAAAYRAQLAKDEQARRSVGQNLLGSGEVLASPQAKKQILAGQIDMRLLVVLIALASRETKLDIVSFGSLAVGESPNLPLRSVDLGTGSAGYVRLQRVVDQQPAPFHRSFDGPIQIGGKTLLKIVFSAPSPLELGAP